MRGFKTRRVVGDYAHYPLSRWDKLTLRLRRWKLQMGLDGTPFQVKRSRRWVYYV